MGMQQFDVLHVVQVSVGRGAAADEDEAECQAAAAGAAKGKVVSAMMRKHLVERMVPIFVELKRMLEARRHPLLQSLMLTLRVLLKDHKNEAGHLRTTSGNATLTKNDPRGSGRSVPEAWMCRADRRRAGRRSPTGEGAAVRLATG